MTEIMIPLTRGYIAIVDPEDYDELAQFNWYALVAGPHSVYAARDIRRGGKRICEYMHARLTGYPQTDHKNGEGLDNRRSNLRRSTQLQNMRNARSRSGSSSKYLGVCWYKKGGKWMARITIEGRGIHLGYHEIEEDAARAYDKAAYERDPQFCRLNFPKDYRK